MRRLFWLGIGLAVGVVVVHKLNKTMRSYSPRGLASSAKEQATGLVDSARSFIADVKGGMAEHEEELIEVVAADTDTNRRQI